MTTMFSSDAITTFKLNNVDYAMHHYILKQMSIFNVLFDDHKIDGVLELEWPISNNIIEMIFVCMYENNFSKYQVPETNIISHCIEAISFMKYLGIDESLIFKLIKKIVPVMKSDFIGTCLTLSYHPEMQYILKNVYPQQDLSIYNKSGMIPKVIAYNSPINFKIEMLRLVIENEFAPNSFDIIFAITYAYGTYDHHKFENILDTTVKLVMVKNIYSRFGFDIQSYEINHSNLQITSIRINNKNIELENLIDKSSGKGTIGVNIYRVISTHIAKLLLKIEVL